MGQREDRRYFFPGHDLISVRRRQQVDVLETRNL
jgi:hypothetical protein